MDWPSKLKYTWQPEERRRGYYIEQHYLQSALTFSLSHNWLPTQNMNVMFPDTSPRGMSLYVRISPITILKWYSKHLILIILAHLVKGRSRTHNLKSSCFFMGVISFQCGQQDPIHAVHTKITYISFRNICTLFELVNVIFPIKLSFVVFFSTSWKYIYIAKDFTGYIALVDRIPVSLS